MTVFLCIRIYSEARAENELQREKRLVVISDKHFFLHVKPKANQQNQIAIYRDREQAKAKPTIILLYIITYNVIEDVKEREREGQIVKN